jgi:predicted pyridoxine 5'-phosphate oxidase superfamily flavin-nucleotide-binding protein
MERDSPFHIGERAVQSRAGVAEKVVEMGRIMLRDHLIQQHVDFYPLLHLIFVGAVDPQGAVWASVLTGAPGFVHAVDSRNLEIGALPAGDDPLSGAIAAGARIGVVGLQFHTRRRNRLNGRIVSRDGGGFVVGVDQSFGNCPKYIQTRWIEPRSRAEAAAPAVIGAALDRQAADLVGRTDTLFIASVFGDDPHDCRLGADVNHRGGRPGFVRVESPRCLTFPDFVGNNAFQTLGNITVDPRVGLLFLDFVSGDLVQLTGTAEIVWDPAAAGAAVPPAQRQVRVQIERVVRRPAALEVTGKFLEWSPQLPEPSARATGGRSGP